MKLDVNITQGSYWKGGQVPYWLYMTLVIFPLTGLLGVDHLLLRSPITAILKVLSIIPLFGFWYFYDISQVLGERELIEKFGIGVPFYGPMGIGAGIFTGAEGTPLSPPDIARPWRFMFYVLATAFFIVFPINKIILGDYVGAFSQLVMYIMFPLTFVAIGWGFYDAYNIIFKTQDLFEKGSPRVPPASWIIGSNFKRSALGPLPDEAVQKSWFSRLFSAAAEVPIAGFAVAANVVKASDAVSVGVVGEGADHIKEVMNKTTGVAEVALDSSTGVIKAAGDAVEKITALAGKLPEITEKMGAKLSDPSVLMKAAAKTSAIKHVGGSISSDPALSSSVLLFSVGVLAFGGYVLYSMRKTITKTTEDDPPPDPRAVRGASKALNA
jgi:hypothetical protein